MSPTQRGPGRPDTVGHSSVQAWSAGALFPAVIAVIERYAEFPTYTAWLDAVDSRDYAMPRRRAPLTRYPRGSYTHYQEERAAFYSASADRLQCTSYELTIGAFREEYATREDAELVARWTCADGRIIPERYAQLVPGAGKSMAALGRA